MTTESNQRADDWMINVQRGSSECTCRMETQREIIFAGQRWMECAGCGARVLLGARDDDAQEREDRLYDNSIAGAFATAAIAACVIIGIGAALAWAIALWAAL